MSGEELGEELVLMSECMNRNVTRFVENLKSEKDISNNLILETITQLKEIVEDFKEFLQTFKNQKSVYKV